MVFFGSLSRTMNYSRSIRGLTIDPGNTTGVKLGSILAISPGTSMRAGLELSRAAGATINGTPLPGSSATAGFFNTGFSFGLTPRQLLNIEAGIGLTTDSPDFRIEASLPIRF